MDENEPKKEKKEKTMFSIKYVGDRREKIEKLMKKYNKLTIASLIDELLLIGELNNDSLYTLSDSKKDEPLLKALEEKNTFERKQVEEIHEKVNTLERDIKEIKHFLMNLDSEEKEKLIQNKKRSKITFDESEEDF